LMIECAVIVPYFFLSYGNTLVFVMAVLLACAAQYAVEGVAEVTEALLVHGAGHVTWLLGSVAWRFWLKSIAVVVGIVAMVAIAVGRVPADRWLHASGDPLPESVSKPLDLVGPPTVWAQRAAIVKQVDSRGILVDGSAESRYSYLLVSAPRPFAAGTYI